MASDDRKPRYAQRVVEDNAAQSRFELRVGEELAVAEYRRQPGHLTFVHTEVPNALRGQGLGSQLARGALELIRARGEKVASRCSFMTAFLEKHPEFDDLRSTPDAAGS